MATLDVPASSFFAVAMRVCQAQVEQVAASSQAARQDVFDVGAKPAGGIKAQPAAADQAFARPEPIAEAEGGIGGGNRVFLFEGHRRFPASAWCENDTL